MDLTGRTWLQIMTAQTAAESGQDVPAIVLVLIVAVMAAAGLLVTFLSTLGDEIGWRGWLWPALTPLGRVPAAIVGGVIWSLWHLPVVLIGHNYPGESRPVAVAMFLLPCIGMSLLFGVITDRAAGSPIPAALAHAAINSLSGTALMVVATTQTMENCSTLVDGPRPDRLGAHGRDRPRAPHAASGPRAAPAGPARPGRTVRSVRLPADGGVRPTSVGEGPGPLARPALAGGAE